MQLVIKDGFVIAAHRDDQQVSDKYPGCEVVHFSRPFEWWYEVDAEGSRLRLPTPDPRTDEEKALAYRDERRAAYPPLADQFDMIYWDQVNGTTFWRDAIAAIKARHPKPC